MQEIPEFKKFLEKLDDLSVDELNAAQGMYEAALKSKADREYGVELYKRFHEQKDYRRNLYIIDMSNNDCQSYIRYAQSVVTVITALAKTDNAKIIADPFATSLIMLSKDFQPKTEDPIGTHLVGIVSNPVMKTPIPVLRTSTDTLHCPMEECAIAYLETSTDIYCFIFENLRK